MKKGASYPEARKWQLESLSEQEKEKSELEPKKIRLEAL